MRGRRQAPTLVARLIITHRALTKSPARLREPGSFGAVRARLFLGVQVGAERILDEQRADHQRHRRDHDRVPEAVVDVAPAALIAKTVAGSRPPNQPLPM